MRTERARKALAFFGLAENSLHDRVIKGIREELRIRGLEYRLDGRDTLKLNRPNGPATVVLESLVRACGQAPDEQWPGMIAQNLGVAELPVVAPRVLDGEGRRRWMTWEQSTNSWSPRQRRDVQLARTIRDEFLRRGYAFGIPEDHESPPMRFELLGAYLQVAVPGANVRGPIEPADISDFFTRCAGAPTHERAELVSKAVDRWTNPGFWQGQRAKTRPLTDDDAIDATLELLGDNGCERLRRLLCDDLERRGFERMSGDATRGDAAAYGVDNDLIVYLSDPASDGLDLLDTVELIERCAGTEAREWPHAVSAWVDTAIETKP